MGNAVARKADEPPSASPPSPVLADRSGPDRLPRADHHDEHGELFDGGGFVSVGGVYSHQPQDYDHAVVRRLILDRRIAPFYKGLPEDPDPDRDRGRDGNGEGAGDGGRGGGGESGSETEGAAAGDDGGRVPCRPRPSPAGGPAERTEPPMAAADGPAAEPDHAALESAPAGPASSGTAARRQSAASTATTAASVHAEPRDLYKFAIECPICFLYYPANINCSRCCDQPVCTECFLQLKRSELTNAPVECPFCVEPNFGVVYKGTDCHYGKGEGNGSSPQSVKSNARKEGTRRKEILSYADPLVVTCDDVRPDFMRRYIEARYRGVNPRRVLVPGPSFPAERRARGATQSVSEYYGAVGTEIEELMVIEAVRLSLLDEEQRKLRARRRAEAETRLAAGAGGAADASPPSPPAPVELAAGAPVNDNRTADRDGHSDLRGYGSPGEAASSSRTPETAAAAAAAAAIIPRDQSGAFHFLLPYSTV